MPRRRADHNALQNAHYQPASSHQAPLIQQQQQQQQQQQLRPDPQVQRSQGVIFLSSNKPQIPVAQPQPPPAPSLQAHTAHLAHQVNQVPAHHASMFQPQHMPTYQSLMQNTLNPFFPYYHPLQAPAPVTSAPTSNDVYTPNGAGISYDNSMQVPPSPIRTKPKRRSRYTADTSSSSSEAEFNDDEEDPDWDPTGGGGGGAVEEPPEPIFESRRGATRGRRASSTPRGRGRGRGSRGGGRGRGRGGRGRVSDLGVYRTDAPPNLTDQTAQMQSQLQLQGRQTRSTISMPLLDPQAGQMSFGELVSAAVQSLNDAGEEYSAGVQKKKKRLLAAVVTTESNKVVTIKRIEVSTPATMFISVDTSQQGNDEENMEEMSLEVEEEDLIMAYEITQEEDRQRPFMCEICGSKSRSRVLHNRHLVTHAPNLPFACCICSQLFENTEKLKPHLRIHHGTGIFVCPELDCEGVFQERKSLDDHDFACHPNARPHPCRFCYDRFPSVADAQAHEDAHDEEITASCMKCSATYKTKTDLKNHYSHMHEEKTCKFCEKKFENQPTLEEHLNEMHEEEMKPPPEPTPPQSPESPGLDDDPMHSPAGGNDEDDIVVVEEHKKATPASSNRRNESRKPKGPQAAPKIKPISKARVPPPFSITKPARPIKPKPSTSIASSSDVITLSSDSDDDKDPEWKAPENLRSSRSPIKRSTRKSKKAEYIIVLESRDDQAASDVVKKTPHSNQPLTFVLGDSGDLVHVPTSSDPRPPDSLPIKEIMEVIKRQKLTDNTTIVIQDNKISSVKPSDSPSKSDKTTILSRSNGASKESSEKKWLRPIRPAPAPESSSSIKKKPESSTDIGRSSELHLKFKPPNLVAKKRTGGIPRSDRSDKEKSSASSSSSEEKKPKPAGPIAKKRTGGSSRVYEEIKQKQSHNTIDVERKKQPRKEIHVVRDDDDDEPLIIEHSGLGPRPVGVTVQPRPQPPKVAFKNVNDSSSNKKGKKGRKKGSSKTQRRLERQKHKLPEDQEESGGASFLDYDNAPKRSLRLALKTSVTDSQGDESQPSELDDPIATDDYLGDEDYSSGSRKRGRPSVKTQPQPIASSSSAVNRGFNSLAEGASTSATSNGQVVMKALVNGKWQDVVIGTKLANDNTGPTPAPAPVPSITRPTRIPPPPPPVKPLNAKKSTAGSKKPPKPPAKSAYRSGSGGGARRGRKSKNAPEPPRECWSDDRYQYFSGTNNTEDTSHMYPVPDAMSFKNDNQADYSLNQSYEDDTDTVMPFSLSTLYMDYQQEEQNESNHPIDHDPQDDQVPVIISAYHVESANQTANYPQSYLDNSGGVYKNEVNDMNQGLMDEGDDADEIPLHDPLAMDMDDDVPPQQEMAEEDDPLGCAEPDPLPPQPPQPAIVAEPKKGTVQEAKSAISNLRSVLSQITFKR